MKSQVANVRDAVPSICGERLTPSGAPCCRREGHYGMHVPITHDEAPGYVEREWVAERRRRYDRQEDAS